ncbi:sialidase family protein [Jiangella aurantiaca]|nr:sialidase family protein [Jiangella aurantiaca]
MTRLGQRKRFSLLAVLTATLAVLLGGYPLPAAAAIVETVVVPGGPCGDSELGTNCQAYFPDIVNDPFGDADDLLMVYRWSSAHSRVASQLRMMRSTDGGATWQQATPFIVADYTGVDYRDPSLAVVTKADGTKRLLLSYFAGFGTNFGTLQTQVKRRDTATGAFSAPVQVFSSTIPYPATSAKIIQMANGQLLIPLYGTNASTGYHDAVVVASVDHGVTWDGRLTGRQKTIAAGSAGRYFQEPAIAQIDPGDIRAVLRVASDTSPSTTTYAMQSESYDNTYMTTWTTPWSMNVRMHGPELFRIPGTNLIPYLWSEPNTATSPTNRPVRITVRRTDSVWTETPRHTLYNPGTTWDAGYSGTVAIGTTRLVTVVYDEARRAAIVLRYNVTDVD